MQLINQNESIQNQFPSQTNQAKVKTTVEGINTVSRHGTYHQT
jgi:hypothetical protein